VLLQPFMTEKVVLRKKNGERHEFRANVQPTKIMTDQANLLVEEGDFIERACRTAWSKLTSLRIAASTHHFRVFLLTIK
jgi:hypothetical protein